MNKSHPEYTLLEKLGEGTFGCVYKAKDKESQSVCALKKLRLEDHDENTDISFLREMVALTYLKSEHVVSMIAYIWVPHRMYIILDYQPQDLKKYIDKNRDIPLQYQQSIINGIVEGLNSMHRLGFVHRDLKPANILVDDEGNAKIADLGLAKKLSKCRKDTGEVCTLWYRPPEILLRADNKSHKYGPEIDMWAVGCIAYELFMRRPLFPGESEIDMLFKIFKVFGTENVGKYLKFDKANFPNFSVSDQAFTISNKFIQNTIKKYLVIDPIERRALCEPCVNNEKWLQTFGYYPNGEMTDGNRAIVVEWMIEVCEQYKVGTDVLINSVYMFDYYVEKYPMTRQKFQLLATVCMSISSQYMEVYPPDYNDFIHICDNAYTEDELLKMRKQVLIELDFKILFATFDYRQDRKFAEKMCMENFSRKTREQVEALLPPIEVIVE